MENGIFIGDMIEENGKSIKENNMEIKHDIPLGTIVEIITWDKESQEKYGGLRLFVVECDRDCDNTPLYGLSWDIELIGKTRQKIYDTDHMLTKTLKFANRHNVNRGFSEENLKIIKRKVS